MWVKILLGKIYFLNITELERNQNFLRSKTMLPHKLATSFDLIN